MSHPVGALRAMRGQVKNGGAVVIADEKVAEEFTAPGLERLMNGWSAVHCLAVGMTDGVSAGTGTVMRPSRLRQHAREAGFADRGAAGRGRLMDVLPASIIDSCFLKPHPLF